MGLLWLFVFPGLAWGLPGFLASRWCLPTASPLERVATAAAFGAALVVPLAYTVPYLTRQPTGPGWILGTSLLVSLLFGALLRFRPRLPHASPATPGHLNSQGIAVTLGVSACILFIALSAMPRSFESVEIFSPCPHQASMFLLEDGSGNGLETWDPLWQQRVAHVTEHAAEPGYGLAKILTIQRIGSAATLVQHFVFHGSGALPAAGITYFGIVGLFTALLFSLSVRSKVAVVVLTGIALIGYRLAAVYMVNENMLAASLITATLWLCMRHRFVADSPTPLAPPTPDGPTLALAALVYALAVATRPELGLVLPALLIAGRPWTPRRFLLIGGLAALAMTPWLITMSESFGQALYHPSLARGRIPVNLLGMEFLFHPLNWPFIDVLSRPETDPYPNLLMLPLQNLQHFGVPFVALALLGAARSTWRRTLVMLAFALPIYLILLMIVNLDRDKLSYCVMSFAPLTYFAGAGFAALSERPPLAKRRIFITAGVALAAVLALPQALRGLELPIDPRRQLNESREGRDFAPIDEKRTELLTPVLLPFPIWPDATQGLQWSGSLLWNGRPVHRSTEPAQGRVHFWCEFIPLIRTIDVVPMGAPNLPPYVSDPNDFELTKNYVPFSVAVATTSASVQVTFERTNTLDVAIRTTGQPGPVRYLTLALLDDGEQEIEGISITIDGVPAPLTILIAERSDRPTKPVLVSNHPWHYGLVEDPESHTESMERLVFVPGPWPTLACPERSESDRGPDILFGPDGVIDRREGHRRPPIRLRLTDVYPPRGGPTCPALEIEGSPHR